MDLGIFIPIGNNGWIISMNSPQYKPSFRLNRTIAEKAEAYDFNFLLSMVKLRGFGGPTEFWDHNLESFTLMAGLAAVTERIQLFASVALPTLPPALVARMASTIDDISDGRFGINIVSGWNQSEYAQMGLWPGDWYYERRYDYASEYVTILRELWATGQSDFQGEFFTMHDCRLSPRPKGGCVPIVCAGQSERGMRFCAAYGDYQFIIGHDDFDRTAADTQRLLAHAQQTERDVGPYAMSYDYIVVGAGSAGCAVAARLSEHAGAKVLLLEAGGPDDEQNIHVPAMFPFLFKASVDWAYETEPQRHLNGRSEYMPRGKMLGGSSSMNAMVYQRSHAADYDRWAALGNEGWSWNDVLPYFKKAENQERGASRYHGLGGPLNVADLRDPNPLSLAFVKACEEQGLPLTDDFNDGVQEGFGLYQVTQKGGQRCSACVGYLRQAFGRDNLAIITGAHVLRLAFDGTRCTGAVYRKDHAEHTVEAGREVILCGGAINSPQLLMLSGVGPKEQLRPLGIDVLLELPGVGKNLQDHLMVPVAYHCTQPITLALARERRGSEEVLDSQRGVLSSNIAEAGGFMKLDRDSPAPELQFHFCPGWFVMHGAGNPPGHGFTLLPGLVGTKSVGSLKLRSADPSAPPRIDPNFLAEEADIVVLVEGVKLARKILSSPLFDTYRGEEYLPGSAVQSDGEIRVFIRNYAQNMYHPVGTCKMGNDPLAVVNDRLEVHGVQGLRVADASIMPVIINANTNAPCIMIGEKCADMVLKAS